MQTQMISSLRCDQIFIMESIGQLFFFFFGIFKKKGSECGVEKTLREVQGLAKSASLPSAAEQCWVSGHRSSSVLLRSLRSLMQVWRGVLAPSSKNETEVYFFHWKQSGSLERFFSWPGRHTHFSGAVQPLQVITSLEPRWSGCWEEVMPTRAQDPG